MEIKLNVYERLLAMQLLPQEGNYITLKLIRDLSSKLGLSADEMKEYDIKQLQDKEGKSQVSWNAKGNEGKDIDFKEKEVDLIKDVLAGFDKDKKLEQKYFTLYEKFVEGDKNAK